MTYKGFTINAEVIQERALVSLDENGNIDEYLQEIDTEQEITAYEVTVSTNDELREWTNTLDEAKQLIDQLIEEDEGLSQ